MEDQIYVDFGYYEGEGWIDDREGHVVPASLWYQYDDARAAMRDAQEAIMQYPYQKKSVSHSPLIGY